MRFGSRSVLFVALLGSVAAAPRSALRRKQSASAETPRGQERPQPSNHRRRLPSSCAGYDTSPETTARGNVLWTGGAGAADTEWLNKSNWYYGSLPGIHTYNKIILAAGDGVTIHCDVTYLTASGAVPDVAIEARSGATLDATADLVLGREMVLKTNAAVTQSGTSQFTFGKVSLLSCIRKCIIFILIARSS